ncbi:hypothetical protein L484_001407 [Morus notabilis]|uniref:Uncharacterized protein n=1 Tax=Morus notabilis TaxID=981085 RepID=W9RZB4_9ROSA|nr:hypothetical protein L484_001407 [Morus notabilis]
MERMRETMQRFQSHLTTAWGQLSHFRDTIWWPLLKSSALSPVVFTVLFLLFVGAFVSTRFLNSANLAGPTITKISERPPQKIEIPLNCTAYDTTRTCPSNYTTAHNKQDDLDRHRLPRVQTLPMDLRRPETMGPHRNIEGYGGEGQTYGRF